MKTRKIGIDQLDTLIADLRRGEVVAFPTDTVFGIACIPQAEAIAKMKWVKGRDEKKPFPMMVSGKEQIESIAVVTKSAASVIERFMPGAITVILNKKPIIGDAITNGQPTIAIRMPDDETVLRILRETGPLLVTSANLSGQPAGHTDQDVLDQLAGRISCILAGESGRQTASTIVDCTQETLRILREGPISLARLEGIE